MFDKLDDYCRAERRLPKAYRLWPLYGVGFENMGRDGKPVEEPLLTYGPDELLIRHDSSGLCFSDTKVIAQGQIPRASSVTCRRNRWYWATSLP